MAKMSKEVISLFQDAGVPKMVATVDKNGVLNVTPKTSNRRCYRHKAQPLPAG